MADNRKQKVDILSPGNLRGKVDAFSFGEEEITENFFPYTSLNISDNSLINSAVSISCNRACFDVHPWQNVLGGGRYSYALTAAEHDSIQFDFVSNVDLFIDHLIFADWAALLIGATYQLQGSTNGVDYSDVIADSEISSEHLVVLYPLTSFKYWRLILSAETPRTWVIGKIFLGQFIDLQREPDSYEVNLIKTEKKFIADSGALFASRTDNPLIEAQIKWAGITDSVAIDYHNRVVAKQTRRKFFLVATQYQKVLGGKSSLLVEAKNAKRIQPEALPNWNALSATFTECRL